MDSSHVAEHEDIDKRYMGQYYFDSIQMNMLKVQSIKF